jgi:uncharacterized glyoxalase superfamily protein PhnB
MENRARYPIWPVVIYKDGRAAIRFLVEAFGFEESAVYSDEKDENVIVHAELRWPGGGGVMLGSTGGGEPPFSERATGAASIYVVIDEPDALYARVENAGAEIVRPLRDEDYGSRGFSAADPEGNIWSFGTYAGEGS